MEFTESKVCKSQYHCKRCRSLHGGRFFRIQLANNFKIERVDFECPYGKKWGDVGIVIDPEVYDDMYASQIRTCWPFVNFILEEAQRGKVKLTENENYRKVLDLLDADQTNIQFTTTKGSKTAKFWGCKPTPTKTVWDPNSKKTNKIAFQFNSRSEPAPRWDIKKFEAALLPEHELVELPEDSPLEELINLAVDCDFFVGVSNGVSQILHSVGIPMYLMTYENDIRHQHKNKKYVFCRGMDDLLAKIRSALENKKHLLALHPPPENEKPGCSSKFWQRIKDLGGTLNELRRFVHEHRTKQVQFNLRKKICEDCQEEDSKGERLFRPLSEKYFTCGRLRVAPTGLLRDSKVDGCGCILNLKWAGLSQTCVRGRWPKLEPPKPKPPKTKAGASASPAKRTS